MERLAFRVGAIDHPIEPTISAAAPVVPTADPPRFNEWLRSNVAQIGTAIQEAIDKRADLDRGATSAMGERSLDTQDAAVPHSVPTRKRRQ